MTNMTDTAALAAIGAATRELRLPVVRSDAERFAGVAQRTQQSYLAFLAEVLSAEVDERIERRRQRRINEARFPRTKRLSDFDLGVAPSINAATIATLATGAYLDAGEPVVLLGDSARASPTSSSASASLPANKDAAFATPLPLSSSTSSPKPSTNGACRASWPVTGASICSASTSSATSS